MVAEFELRRLQRRELGALAALLSRVFGRPFAEGSLRNKYFADYGCPVWSAEAESPSVVAWRGDQAVGFMGALPYELEREGERYGALQLCEFATAPEARRQGLNALLFEEIRDHAEAIGVDLLFAMGTDQSAAAIQRVGMRVDHTMRFHTFSTGSAGLRPLWVKLATRVASYRRGLLEKLQRRLQAASRVPREAQVAAGEWVNPLRGADRLTVRYGSRFLRSKSLFGMQAIDWDEASAWTKLRGDELHIGAIRVQADMGDAAIERLVTTAGALGVRRVIAHSGPAQQLTLRSAETGDSFVVGRLALSRRLEGVGLRLNYLDFETF